MIIITYANFRNHKALQAALSIVVVFDEWERGKCSEVFLFISLPPSLFSSSEPALCFAKLDKREIEYLIFCYVDYNWISCGVQSAPVWSTHSHLRVCTECDPSSHTCNIFSIYIMYILTKYYGHLDFSLRTLMRWIQVNAWLGTLLVPY